MKLAEALNLRRKLSDDYSRAITALKKRLRAKEDKDFGDLADEFIAIAKAQRELATRIERTNFATSIKANGDILSLNQALCHRLILADAHAKLQTAIKGKSSAPGCVLQAIVEMDDLRQELDDAIQQANWTTELV